MQVRLLRLLSRGLPACARSCWHPRCLLPGTFAAAGTALSTASTAWILTHTLTPHPPACSPRPLPAGAGGGRGGGGGRRPAVHSLPGGAVRRGGDPGVPPPRAPPAAPQLLCEVQGQELQVGAELTLSWHGAGADVAAAFFRSFASAAQLAPSPACPSHPHTTFSTPAGAAAGSRSARRPAWRLASCSALGATPAMQQTSSQTCRTSGCRWVAGLVAVAVPCGAGWGGSRAMGGFSARCCAAAVPALLLCLLWLVVTLCPRPQPHLAPTRLSTSPAAGGASCGHSHRRGRAGAVPGQVAGPGV